ERCLEKRGLQDFADAIVGPLGVEHRKRTTIGVELAAKRDFEDHYRNLTYLMAKLMLHIAAGLFIYILSVEEYSTRDARETLRTYQFWLSSEVAELIASCKGDLHGHYRQLSPS
ncbi:hypothetical protein JAAARDRAFT_296169, partial [Jaapia argillacea MUCL 33604]